MLSDTPHVPSFAAAYAAYRSRLAGLPLHDEGAFDAAISAATDDFHRGAMSALPLADLDEAAAAVEYVIEFIHENEGLDGQDPNNPAGAEIRLRMAILASAVDVIRREARRGAAKLDAAMVEAGDAREPGSSG